MDSVQTNPARQPREMFADSGNGERRSATVMKKSKCNPGRLDVQRLGNDAVAIEKWRHLMSCLMTIAGALEEASQTTEVRGLPQCPCDDVLAIVAFRPDVQCIDVELESGSAQPDCCGQTVCSVDDEISGT